ncbi:MAG: methyltransferase domain-containing protein [Halolamina sp.]
MAVNVVPVTADVATLPFRDGELDGAVSTRTFHHGLNDALPEIKRVLGPGGRLVVVDWSATGAGERDHARDEEYFDVATVQSRLLEAGFRIRHARERRETFVIIAVAP